MAASEATVKERVTDILNIQSPGSWSSTVASTNLDRNSLAVAEAVREAAMMIAKAIVANPSHVHRNVFVSGTPTSLTHGSELPDMSGESDIIEIQPYTDAEWITGVPKSPQQIDSFRANSNNFYSSLLHNAEDSPLGGFYAIDNGRIKFTGENARIYIPVIDRDTVGDVIPDEYEDTWVSCAVPLCLKEGDNLQGIAGMYAQMGSAGLQAITTMSVIPMMVRNTSRGDAV
jgi:hypothetical protein